MSEFPMFQPAIVLVEVRDGSADVEVIGYDLPIVKIDWDYLPDDKDYAMEKRNDVVDSALPETYKARILSVIDEIWSGEE